MPVRIPLSEIANMANASVKDLIFEDNSYEDNNNDRFKIKVWKTRPIRLVGGNNQNLLIEVPLKIWAEKGVGTLGVYTYQQTTFETVMYFNTQITFNTNWTVITNTQPNGFKWITKPVLDYGTVKIPITTLVEKSLKTEQGKFCKILDLQMKNQLNFQNYAVLAWNQFTQPFNVSEDYNTWLKITPLNINITPLKFYRDEIQTTFGIDVYSETFTGQKPESSVPAKKMADFNFIPTLTDKFLLQTTANIPFSEATAIAKKQFLNKEFEVSKGKLIKISDIKVYSETNRIIIEVETDGYVKGTSFISGIPVYDEVKRKILLSDTKFKLKTKNILQKATTLLFQQKIVNLIEDEYGIPTAEIEGESRRSIEKSFNTEYYKGLKLTGKVYGLQPSKILINSDYITAVIDTKASLSMKIQGM